MITDAVLALVRAVLDFIVGLLPDGTLDLPEGSSISTAIGSRVGPLDRFIPIVDALTFLELFLGVYMPVVLAYSVTKWIYRHLPLVGKG